MSQNKVLIFGWESVGKNDIPEVLESMGYEVERIETGTIEEAREDKWGDVVESKLRGGYYRFVFSTNYFVCVACACHTVGVPYIAWAYDSPTRVGEETDMRYDTTNLFLFDSKETTYYRDELGYDSVRYMPLATNIGRIDKLLSRQNNTSGYMSDISFVGRMYESKVNESLVYLDEYRRNFLTGIIDAALVTRENEQIYNICNRGFVDWISNDNFAKVINSDFGGDAGNDRLAYRLGIQLCKAVTNKERLLILSMLSSHFSVNLYSDTAPEILKNVACKGTVDYYTEMPIVFNRSRINLNVTLLNIRAGIPLRCLDVLGAHGVLLSNHQSDFDEHFEDGKNVLLYDSIEEAYEKCKYYLEHETERKKIEDAGYEIVKKCYDYPIVLKEMLNSIGIE